MRVCVCGERVCVWVERESVCGWRGGGDRHTDRHRERGKQKDTNIKERKEARVGMAGRQLVFVLGCIPCWYFIKSKYAARLAPPPPPLENWLINAMRVTDTCCSSTDN